MAWPSSGLMSLRAGLPATSALVIVVVAASHSLAINVVRALWYRHLVEQVRAALLPDYDALQRFADGWRESLVLAALVTGAVGVVAVGSFTYFFIPINLEQYLKLETWFPVSIALLTLGWWLWQRRLGRAIDVYLTAALSPKAADQPTRDDPRAVAAYRAAQSLPYLLAISKVAFWLVGEAALRRAGRVRVRARRGERGAHGRRGVRWSRSAWRSTRRCGTARRCGRSCGMLPRVIGRRRRRCALRSACAPRCSTASAC